MKHYSINIVGKVQGVFFRKQMLEVAKKMGVHGFIRNEKDGSVQIEAEAEEEILNDFLVKCNEGSPKSTVTNLYIEEGAVKDFKEFKIEE